MSLLKDLEKRLRGSIEGLFSRGAGSLQPVELAEWLTEEMDEQRMVGRDKVYAPAEFTVYLSEADADGLAPYMATLAAEIAQYLFDHARERDYSLAHFPQLRFARRDSLPEGEVDIETKLAEPGQSSGTTEVFSSEQLAELKRSHARSYLEMADGTRFELKGDLVRIGRLATGDIVLTDRNVSRSHCVLELEDGAWYVRDLESTNGTKVNGELVDREALQPGGVLTLGTTQLTLRSE